MVEVTKNSSKQQNVNMSNKTLKDYNHGVSSSGEENLNQGIVNKGKLSLKIRKIDLQKYLKGLIVVISMD